MSVLAEFSIVPLGGGESISPQVARIVRIIMESGVSYTVNPMGTVLEGTWDEVMVVIKQCHEEMLKDAGRVLTSISIDDRKGREDRMQNKIASVEQKVGKKLNR